MQFCDLLLENPSVFIMCKHRNGKYGILESDLETKRRNILDLNSKEGGNLFHEHRDRLLDALQLAIPPAIVVVLVTTYDRLFARWQRVLQ